MIRSRAFVRRICSASLAVILDLLSWSTGNIPRVSRNDLNSYNDRLLDEFLRTFDFLQIALKYGYMIQRLVRSIRPKIACAEADIVSWLHLSLHVVSGCVGKRGWCGDVHDRARLSANVSGYPNVTGNKLILDAHCLADGKGLGSKRKSAGSQRTRQWELSIDQRLEFLQRCDSLLYKQCGYHMSGHASIVRCGRLSIVTVLREAQ